MTLRFITCHDLSYRPFFICRFSPHFPFLLPMTQPHNNTTKIIVDGNKSMSHVVGAVCTVRAHIRVGKIDTRNDQSLTSVKSFGTRR